VTIQQVFDEDAHCGGFSGPGFAEHDDVLVKDGARQRKLGHFGSPAANVRSTSESITSWRPAAYPAVNIFAMSELSALNCKMQDCFAALWWR
jgi:hypothetical protein